MAPLRIAPLPLSAISGFIAKGLVRAALSVALTDQRIGAGEVEVLNRASQGLRSASRNSAGTQARQFC